MIPLPEMARCTSRGPSLQRLDSARLLPPRNHGGMTPRARASSRLEWFVPRFTVVVYWLNLASLPGALLVAAFIAWIRDERVLGLLLAGAAALALWRSIRRWRHAPTRLTRWPRH